MDLKNTVSAARILYDSIFAGKTEFAQIPYTPAKTHAFSLDREPFFPKASPRAVGMDGLRLLQLVEELSNDPAADVHSLIVLKEGKCLFEAAKAGYDTRLPHATFSFSKTLTGIAVGFLCEEGKLKLTDKVATFFPEYKPSAKLRALTVAHLLTMQTGITFNEANAVTEESWLRGFFSSDVRFAAGSRFAYNSMNSYVLAALVKRLSGKSLSAFLDARLFAPMGIRNYEWETSADGVEKGGWGLYLSPRNMAKMGQLFLDGGKWEGKQLIPANWFRLMTTPHASTPKEIGTPFDYGYHIWVHRQNGALLLNGMLGQNVLVYPDRALVIAFTAGENSVFHDARSLLAAERILGGELPHSRDTLCARIARARLSRRFGEGGSFTSPHNTTEGKEAEAMLAPLLSGKYLLSKNNSGVLPLLTRLVQNSPTKGVSAILLAGGEKKGTFEISFLEGDAIYTVTAGERRFLFGILKIYGEEYRYGAAYSYGKDENRIPYFKVEIRFGEIPNTRRLLFRKSDDGLLLLMQEHPGILFVDKLMHVLPYSVRESKFMVDVTKHHLPRGYLMRKLGNAFSPLLHLTRAPEGDGEDAKL
ncbi:MAG: serine hydrolase [Clostridia bacterium]|nr:serine hydrolase [Clostridia bacterium]